MPEDRTNEALRSLPTDSVAEKVSKCMLKLKTTGRTFPSSFERTGLPLASYSELLAALEENRCRLWRCGPAVHARIERVLTEPGESLGGYLPIAPLAAFILSLVFAFTVSAWWLLLLLLVPFLISAWSGALARRLNDRVFRAALGSEEAFCFLYTMRMVSVWTDGREWRWEWPNEAQPSAT